MTTMNESLHWSVRDEALALESAELRRRRVRFGDLPRSARIDFLILREIARLAGTVGVADTNIAVAVRQPVDQVRARLAALEHLQWVQSKKRKYQVTPRGDWVLRSERR